MESEGLLAVVADSAQHSPQCPTQRSELPSGSNNDKGVTEEPVNEVSKSGCATNEEDCTNKNHGWKGFSLKRQLSKVDLKIKSTFTPTLVTSQNGVLVCFLSFEYTFRFFLENYKT